MSATLPEQLSEPTRAFASRDFGAAADGRTFDTVDPATGQTIASVPLGGREEVDAAVAAARAAFAPDAPWRRMSAADRGRRIAALAGLIEANAG
ncbi:MAG: aldehyde dehydrogenase family protein, partial [Solirubrobacteraceae bacterium]